MRFILAFASLALVACGEPEVEVPPEVAAAEATEPAAAPGASAGIDGWEVDATAYQKIGTRLPAFMASGNATTEVTVESLRGRWTILGFLTPPGGASSEPLLQGEDSYLAALASAADQDPDLDVLIANPSPTAKDVASTLHGWPVISNASSLITALALPTSPGYLLIGPDLTIEGYRGALSATPDDGIKSVIRGVAEIRKQVAAPQ